MKKTRTPNNQHIKLSLIFGMLCFLTSAFLLMAPPARAQKISLSITPPIIELLIKPGKSVVIAYTVSNLGDPTVIKSYVRPFTAYGNYGDLTISTEFEGPIRFNFENSNIGLDQPFFLESKQGQQLLLKIRVPDGTPEGDYYYSLLAENQPGRLVEGSSVPQTQAVIGAHILITVSESGVRDIQPVIRQFSVKPRYDISIFGRRLLLFESSDTIPVRLVVENQGNNMITPEGKITLNGTLEKNKEFTILPEHILSNTARLLHATPSAQIKDRTISLQIEGFHIGKYTLTSNVNFTGSKNPIRATVSFYALPIKLAFAVLIAIITGVLIIIKMRPRTIEEDEEEGLPSL